MLDNSLNKVLETGFYKLDKIIGGFQSGQLISIVGKPSMGKTSLALSIINNLIDLDLTPILYFTLETSSEQVFQKIISIKSSLPSQKLLSGEIENHEYEILNSKLQNLERSNINFISKLEISIDEIELKIDDFVDKNKNGIVFIDYLQLVTIENFGFYDNREQELSAIIRRLKICARENNIPIVLLSQAHNSLKFRWRRPVFSDLGDAQAIQEDSDLVMFVYRPEYYNIEEWDDDERSPTEGQAEIILAKNRNGSVDNIRLKFIPSLGKFENLDDFDTSFDIQFKLSQSSENPFILEGDLLNSDDDDVPF